MVGKRMDDGICEEMCWFEISADDKNSGGKMEQMIGQMKEMWRAVMMASMIFGKREWMMGYLKAMFQGSADGNKDFEFLGLDDKIAEGNSEGSAVGRKLMTR